MKKIALISTLFLCLVSIVSSQPIPQDIQYLGQTPPGNTPVVFTLPNSTGLRAIERIAISSDGKEIIYGELDTYPPTITKIQGFSFTDGHWSGPNLLFNGYMAPALSPDDNTLYMQKFINGVATTFYSTRNETGWSEPVKMFNFPGESHYVQKSDLNKYFLSTIFPGASQSDLATLVITETDTTLVNIGANINTNMNELDFFVARDESYIIHARSTSTSAGDLFISLKKDDGTWTNSVSLGSTINMPNPTWEYGPFVSDDNQYLFFTRGSWPMSTYNTYWVKIDRIIDSLKIMNGIMPEDSLYRGQPRPGSIPQIFAPGLISLPGRAEYAITFSPNGKEILFSTGTWPTRKTMITEYKNNAWTTPKTVSFSVDRSADEASFSPDGQRIYYYAYNAPNSLGGADLCYSEKPDSVWSEPINLGPSLNTSQDEYHPCIVADGSIYFESHTGKLCYSKYENGSFLPRVILPPMFNSGSTWGNPYVSPDESYFIFSSVRAGGFGSNDLYISYKKEDSSWTNPKNLGNKINTSNAEATADITPDGEYLVFNRNSVDFYWVSSGFVDSLRYTNFIPYVLNPIPDQTDTVGQFYNFTIPSNTFMDDDGNHTLTFGAKLTNGNPLPDWLTLDSITGTFTGTAIFTETLNIKITATDTAGAFAYTTFKIKVETNAIEETVKQNVQIFPNPTTGIVHIAFEAFSGKTAIVEISNLEGKRIHTDTVKNDICINLSAQPKGMYIVKLLMENVIVIQKICVE